MTRDPATAVLKTRREPAACCRMFARRDMDDLIYTHLSARLPGTPGRFLFIPFGMLFDNVTASGLLEVDIAGSDVLGSGTAVNPAGWLVHRTVYDALSEAQCVMHLHTIAGTAVSAQQQGLAAGQPVRHHLPRHAGLGPQHRRGLRPDALSGAQLRNPGCGARRRRARAAAAARD